MCSSVRALQHTGYLLFMCTKLEQCVFGAHLLGIRLHRNNRLKLLFSIYKHMFWIEIVFFFFFFLIGCSPTTLALYSHDLCAHIPQEAATL